MDDSLIKKILKESKTIAVVGLSPKEDRPSFQIAKHRELNCVIPEEGAKFLREIN